MSAAVISMPLPSSVRRAATLPTIVTSRPSRIHTLPRPTTTIQWKRAHGRRSRRDGTSVLIVPSSTLPLISHLTGSDRCEGAASTHPFDAWSVGTARSARQGLVQSDCQEYSVLLLP